MPLRPPPASLKGFPTRRAAASLRTLYRISGHHVRGAGTSNSPWRFSSIPDGRNRFDVPAPHGTCYWSDRRYGAWVEVFRGAMCVDLSAQPPRRIWTGSTPVLRLADLLARKAASFGVTAAISTQPDYALPQLWAEALHRQGFAGLVGTCSHDPSSTALNVAVFGRAGTPRSQPGWTTRAARLEDDQTLLSELAAFGVHLVPAPFDVPTIAAP
ncbi:MAG: RES family NAD+ phosphorylase [Propionicimonas sp.]